MHFKSNLKELVFAMRLCNIFYFLYNKMIKDVVNIFTGIRVAKGKKIGFDLKVKYHNTRSTNREKIAFRMHRLRNKLCSATFHADAFA